MMRLRDAIQVRRGDVVSLVGAGGKTTTMYRLARELADNGWRVVTTTTTMIYPPSQAQSQSLIVESDADVFVRQVENALRSGSIVTLAAERLPVEGKLRGIEPRVLPTLQQLADVVIVEADGARGRSLKAPARHEPVVPPTTTVLLPLVGVDAVGQPLDKAVAHRPQRVACLTGHALGETINTSLVVKLLVHPEGALKDAPPAARVMPLLNKVRSERSLAVGRQIADRLRSELRIERVLLGNVQSEDPVCESRRRVAAVVLAAGAATRFGRPKQLLAVAGTTLIERVLHQLHASGAFEIVVVLGHAAPRIASHIPPWCRVIVNQDWREGISASIRSGLQAISPAAQAVLLVPADQPHIQRQHVDQILQAYYGTTQSIVVPFHRGQRGTPALFDRRHFKALAGLRGDVGGRQLIARFPDDLLAVELPSARSFFDIDTPRDYQRLLNHTDDTGADV
jgi:molybdenum cofactor cytidylyltransferase